MMNSRFQLKSLPVGATAGNVHGRKIYPKETLGNNAVEPRMFTS
jgi:hypothetical protein